LGYLWGTFGVNILGAFLLGFFVTITVEVTRIRSHYRAGIAVGLFGGFTTFSTFMYEGVALIKDNETKNALLYVTLTMVLGIGAFALGWLTRLYL
jgi:CrcB protein